MKTHFFFASHDLGDPWVPRECTYLASLVAVPAGQRLFHVKVSPPLPGRLLGVNEDITEVLLGTIADNWDLHDIGTPGFMVDLYAARLAQRQNTVDVRDLTRLGMATLHRSSLEASQALGE